MLFLSHGKADKKIIDAASLAMDKSTLVLSKNGYCQGVHGCQGLIAYDNFFSDIELNFYNNIDESTINEIINEIKNFKKDNKDITFTLIFYPYKHKDYIRQGGKEPIQKKKAFYKIQIQED